MAEQMALDAQMLKKADAAKIEPAVRGHTRAVGNWRTQRQRHAARAAGPSPQLAEGQFLSVCIRPVCHSAWPPATAAAARSPLLPCASRWEKTTTPPMKARTAQLCRRQSPVRVGRLQAGEGGQVCFPVLHEGWMAIRALALTGCVPPSSHQCMRGVPASLPAALAAPAGTVWEVKVETGSIVKEGDTLVSAPPRPTCMPACNRLVWQAG